MSSHDHNGIDAERAGLVAELRATAPVASPELRLRVREIASRPVVRSRRRPRLAWALAPVAAAAVAATIVVAVGERSSGSRTGIAVERETSRPSLDRTAKAPEALASTAGDAAIAPGDRAQLYAADLTLRVDDLSSSTQQALRATRRLGGYVRSVDYGSGPRSGTAALVVRVPIERVQKAIVQLSGLGKILDQHVSVRDVQPTLNRRAVKIASLREQIPTLSGEERARAEAELARLVVAQARDRQRTSFATVSLDLRTKEASPIVPVRPTQIERAFERAAAVIAAELAALVYVLLVAAPFLVLGAALGLGMRALRRRSDARLMA
jgi:uncharacterized protein DUF4349